MTSGNLPPGAPRPRGTTLGSAARAGGARIATLALIALALSGCGPSSADDGSGDGGRVAFLLPESKTTRYEAVDHPVFEERLTEVCPSCDLIYSNADGDASKQQQQAESALTQDIDVLVLDAVDSSAARSIVVAANARGVPVIAYDREIADADIAYYVSFNGESVGELQGVALVDGMTSNGDANGDIIMINGSPTDPNAQDFKDGAHSVIDKSNLKVIAEYDSPDWSPDKAQEWAAGQVVQHGDRIAGVYAANDGTAGGAIAAFKAAGVHTLPPVTGQDGELAAIQRIIAGDQYMTVYKAIPTQAKAAADAAFELLTDGAVSAGQDVHGVRTTLLDPVSVTKDNIMDTVVADGFYTVDQICTPEYASACADAGIE
ncbi:substrate-binding domain-containing protein [Demequina oxidasica]|uniref:substrate-binding domain-containing protein n=1 Tax=Demequina oxidasica TaxID=676199 RepID=UPI0009FF071C|nr:substrate-binding domain-containing protein [Demequina oxidasica]